MNRIINLNKTETKTVQTGSQSAHNSADVTCKAIGIMGGKKGKRLCGENTNNLSMRWNKVTCPLCLAKKAEHQFEASLAKAAIRSSDDADYPFDEESEFLSQMNYRD